MPRFAIACSLGCVLALAAGCDETPTPPDPPDPDDRRECVEGGGSAPSDGATSMDGGAGAARGCASGEVCVQGRCYQPCSADADCGPREECGAGVCRRRAGAEPDASMPPPPDSGPSDPCALVTCDGDQVCHPLSHRCVDCTEEFVAMIGVPGNCGTVRPVCDLANGTCHGIRQTQCAPCNFDEQCVSLDGSFVGTCVTRDVMGWREQVCLRTCSPETPCPPGLDCNAAGQCEPPIALSCTTWERAVERAMCLSDDDCNITGTRGQSVFFVGTCEGAVVPMFPDAGPEFDGGDEFDAGALDPPTPGRCLQPCGTAADCFDPTGGQSCTDTGRGLTFCIP